MQYMLQEILAAKLRSSHQRCSAKEVLFCESSKNTFSHRTPLPAASAN